MFSSGRRCGKNTGLSRFYWHLGLHFLGFFAFGVLFSCLCERIPLLQFDLPHLVRQLFSQEMLFPGFWEWLPSALYFAAMQTVSVAILFLLGLRAGDFFCLSRIWNLIYFAVHGMLFHRFLVLFLHGCRYASAPTSHRIAATLLFSLFCVMLITLGTMLLQINRAAAKGILIPCFGINRFFYPHTPSRAKNSNLLLDYCLTAAKHIALVYMSEMILLLACYGLRKMH